MWVFLKKPTPFGRGAGFGQGVQTRCGFLKKTHTVLEGVSGARNWNEDGVGLFKKTHTVLSGAFGRSPDREMGHLEHLGANTGAF